MSNTIPLKNIEIETFKDQYKLPFESQYTLDKAFYRECFEQSASTPPVLKAYSKAFALLLLSIFLFNSEKFQINSPVITAWFALAWSILEACSEYFKAPWWVARQMISKESNSKVSLMIDEKGFHTSSSVMNFNILWTDILKIEETQKGYLISHQKGKTYLRKSDLNH